MDCMMWRVMLMQYWMAMPLLSAPLPICINHCRPRVASFVR